MHLGENDLRHMCGEQICSELLRFVDALSVISSTGIVIVGQLIPFPDSPYRASVININDQLLYDVRWPQQFWNHRSGFMQASRQLFRDHDVHLNDTGMQRYWRSVRTVVGRVLVHSGH